MNTEIISKILSSMETNKKYPVSDLSYNTRIDRITMTKYIKRLGLMDLVRTYTHGRVFVYSITKQGEDFKKLLKVSDSEKTTRKKGPTKLKKSNRKKAT